MQKSRKGKLEAELAVFIAQIPVVVSLSY